MGVGVLISIKCLFQQVMDSVFTFFWDLFRDDDPRLQMALHPRVSAVAQGIAVATHSSAARCPRRSALESVFSNRHGAARTSSLLEKYTDTLKHLSDCISESRCKLPA